MDINKTIEILKAKNLLSKNIPSVIVELDAIMTFLKDVLTDEEFTKIMNELDGINSVLLKNGGVKMGNRAIIKAEGNNNKAVYLHWNGGRDSVEAFLKYCELRGFRDFEDDYGMARFCQVVSNFFGADGLSVGITDYVESQGDNGIYVVKGWEIVDRIDFYGREQNDYDLEEMLLEIDSLQPLKQQLGDYLITKEVSTNTVKIGDTVYLMESDGTVKKYNVVGFGEDKYRNGTKVLGLPYVDKYLNDGLYSENINNYLTGEKVRLVVDENKYETTSAFTVTSEDGCIEYWFFTLESALKFYNENSNKYSDLKINDAVVSYNTNDYNEFSIVSIGDTIKE